MQIFYIKNCSTDLNALENTCYPPKRTLQLSTATGRIHTSPSPTYFVCPTIISVFSLELPNGLLVVPLNNHLSLERHPRRLTNAV